VSVELSPAPLVAVAFSQAGVIEDDTEGEDEGEGEEVVDLEILFDAKALRLALALELALVLMLMETETEVDADAVADGDNDGEEDGCAVALSTVKSGMAKQNTLFRDASVPSNTKRAKPLESGRKIWPLLGSTRKADSSAKPPPQDDVLLSPALVELAITRTQDCW
jgi:hypothetical protein